MPLYALSITLRKKCPYFELLWSVFSRIQTEYGEMRTKITPNTDTFHAVTCPTYILTMAIVPFSFISVDILCEFTMV